MALTVKRSAVVLPAVLAVLALGACGGDDGASGSAETTQTQTQPATTTEAAPPKTEEPPFSETFVFSGDEVQRCIEAKGLAAPRESKTPADDKVGQGIVHDRLLISATKGAEPGLRLFMFGSADLAKEQGKLVTDRTPEAKILGTTIFEPLTTDAAKETEAATACLEEQAA